MTLNDHKKDELNDWIKQVEEWADSQGDDNFLTRIRRAAVIWEVPPGNVTKLQKSPVARVPAVVLYGAVTFKGAALPNSDAAVCGKRSALHKPSAESSTVIIMRFALPMC